VAEPTRRERADASPVPGAVYDAALRIAVDWAAVRAWMREAGHDDFPTVPLRHLERVVTLAVANGVAREVAE
jgi:hypothetical protein